jgi:SAM-dependent methyltransferase
MQTEALGKSPLTILDRVGQALSTRPIRKVLAHYTMPRVLDIGCGHDARLLQAFAGRIREGVGIDESVRPEAKAHANLRFFEAPAEQVLPTFADESFDVVMMVSVLEHLWEPVVALKECRRLLVTGGSLILNVPNWLGKVALETAAFRLGLSTADSIDDHKTYYAKRDLWPQVVRAGFRPSRIRMHYHKLGLNLFAVAVK